MIRTIFTALILAFLLSSLSLAGELTGYVIGSDKLPVVGANIQSDIGSLITETDDNGFFRLIYNDQVPTYFTITHVSFQPKMISIEKYRKNMTIMLESAVYPGQKIRVTAMRAEAGVTPVAFTDFTEKEIERDHTVGDFPLLLSTTPNMYAFSYTGGATGATDFKIRGFDSKRISVYINGIPLNDPEDRFTYFYDLADFAAEVGDIQVQRGVGNSFYGDATFGGSINIASEGLERERKVSISTGYGQYFHDGEYISDIRKQALEYSSGLINGRWSFAGRYSKLYSGGYRDGAWYDGWAYFLSVSRLDANMTTTVNLYGGPMKAHQAWYGIDRNTQNVDRTYNPTNYVNEIDNFNQPHYEIHNTIKLNENATLNNALYYIRGKGYYEEFRYDNVFNYGIPSNALIDTTIEDINLVRQKWVAKNQYGWNPRIDFDHQKGSASVGGAFYYFESEHWGEFIWGENLNANFMPRSRFYQFNGKKYSASIFALETYSLSDKIILMGNLQLRYLKYDFSQTKLGNLPGYEYDLDWLFFSPRFGLTYQVQENADVYFSFSIASREPTDKSIYDADEITAQPQLEVESISVSGTDTTYNFGDPIISAERLYNFELGGNLKGRNFKTGLSLFWMEFKNEIVPNGTLDFSGLPAMGNAERSVHAGVELNGALAPHKMISLSGNFSFNYNRIKDYIAYNDIYYDGSVIDTVDYSGNPVPGFPEYIGNLIADMNYRSTRLVYRWRTVGKQYMENGANDSLAIGTYMTSSLSAFVKIGDLAGLGDLTLSGHIDNLWNAKYEQSGYAYIWWGEDWVGEYYPAAERNFYIQLKMELK